MNNMQNNQDNKNGSQKRNNSPPSWLVALGIFLAVTIVMNLISSSLQSRNYSQIEYSQFLKLVENDVVDQVQIEDSQITLSLKEDADEELVRELLMPDAPEEEENAALPSFMQSIQNQVFYTGRVPEDSELIGLLREYDVAFYTPVIQESSSILSFLSSWILPLLIMYLIYFIFIRSIFKRMGGAEGGMGRMMSVGKSKAKMYSVEKNTGVTFSDVAGQDEAKESLTELVDYLHHPEKYKSIGAKQPKGALLVGPPGTGKTLLAKAVAGEAHVPFFSLSGSEFVEMYVGVGASRVRDLFEQAAKNAPCIVFIDEIDAIGKRRDTQMGNDEREQTLNQLLAEMDGFDSTKGVVILAATNRPEVLDPALLRAGRFDRRIVVEKPDLPGRESILKVHAAKVSIGPDVDLHQIALTTSGATGADLANMLNEAALRAVRMGRKAVLQEDIMEAVEVVIAGKEKKDRILNQSERRRVAYHEIGHALAAVLQKNSTPVQKITIIPRTMGSLGYTMNAPEEERYLLTQSELTAQIVSLLAGRAAEEVQFGEASTGATNDIERATQLARNMVAQYGMSDKFGMMNLESSQSQYLDGRPTLLCSEATGAEIDNEVRKLLQKCYDQALLLLKNNKSRLDKLSAFLIERETITGTEFMEILSENEPEIA